MSESSSSVPPQYARFDARKGTYESDGVRNRPGATSATTVKPAERTSSSSSSSFSSKDSSKATGSQSKASNSVKAWEELRPIMVSTLMLIFGSIAWIYFTPLVGKGGVGGGSGSGLSGGQQSAIRRVRGRFWEDPFHQSGRRMQDTRITATVPLSSLYSGVTVTNISFTRREICPHCSGAGGLGMRTCEVCQGQGAEIFTMQVAPGHFQRMQQTCHRCGGQGRVAERTCHHCNGEGMVQKHVTQPILLSPGLQAGDMIRLPNQGDQHTHVGAGDIIVEIAEERPSRSSSSSSGNGATRLVATRPTISSSMSSVDRTDDLEVECAVTLKEALLGFKREVYHPGSQAIIDVTSPPGKVSSPGEIIRLRGKGMPSRSNTAVDWQLIVPPEEGGNGKEKIIEMQKKDGIEQRRMVEEQAIDQRIYGDLRVVVKVKLPEKLTLDQKKVIEELS